MQKISIFTLLILFNVVFAQEATEQFIPIGQSPGLSGVSTIVGTVDSLDLTEEKVTVSNVDGMSYSGTCIRTTRIWLDRSAIKESNKKGGIEDCQKGRLIEMKYVDNDAEKGIIEWIKVKISSN